MVSMIRIPIILIAALTFTACTKKVSVTPVANNTDIVVKPTSSSDTLSYLALGDSYTIGEGVTTSASYPYQLYSALNAQSIIVSHPIVVAKPGWTTDDLINATPGFGVSNMKFNIVTLMIGVNDEAQGLSQSNYKIKFAQELNTAINFANGNPGHVFVLSIPDWGVTPFAKGQESVIGPQIDSFNDINKGISLNAGVNYLDITAISKEAAADTTLITNDGLHPSAKMYGLWIQQLEPLVAAALKK